MNPSTSFSVMPANAGIQEPLNFDRPPASSDRGHTSRPDDFGGMSPHLNGDELSVYSLLRRGRENARNVDDLSRATGIASRRVRRIVKSIIEDSGVLVCSSTVPPCGYYLPETTLDYSLGVSQLIDRIASLAKRVRAMDRQSYETIIKGGRLWE